MTPPDSAVELLRARHNPVAAWVLRLTAAGAAAVALAEAATGGLSSPRAALSRVLVPLSLAAVGFLAAQIPGRPKGGAWLLRDKRALRLGGSSATDFLELSLDQVMAVRPQVRRLWQPDGAGGEWVVELLVGPRAAVVLATAGDEEAATEFADALRAQLPPQSERTPPHSAWAPSPELVAPKLARAGLRWAMSSLVFALGACSLAVSATLLWAAAGGVPAAILFGVVAGAPLGMLAIAMLGVWGFKAAGVEALRAVDGAVQWSYRLGTRLGAQRSLKIGESSYVRVWPRGVRGFLLEVVGTEGALVALAGSTSSARNPPSLLVAQARSLGAQLEAAAPAAPSVQAEDGAAKR
jgi:hypothetical protein